MTEFAPVQGTQTTLRIPPRSLLVGKGLRDAAPLVEQLIDQGYLVLAEVELARALAKLRTARFEFVMLDIDGAGAGGEEFVATLRGDSQLEGLPVLVISRSDNIDAIGRFLECGADDYLPNVCGPAVLRVRLNAAVIQEE